MLKPAILYKERLNEAIKPYFYTEDMFYYNGCIDSAPIEVADDTEQSRFQFAIVNKDDDLLGYIGFIWNCFHSSASRFGAISFDRGNPIVVRDMLRLVETLIKKVHRVEFASVEGCPAIKGYEKFLERHSDIGRRIKFCDSVRDLDGKFRGLYVYEFVNPEVK